VNPPRLPLHIVKLGGSLLAWPDLPRAINSWLTAQPPAIRVFLCGGGPFADSIRQADHDFALGEEASHWLCVDCLALTARLLAKLVSASTLITDFGELQKQIAAGQSGPLMIFDPCDFLQHHEVRQIGSPLPHTWQATSDSIAARLAEVLAADELVLLKSAAPTAGDLTKLAVAGYVDPYFPEAARNVRHVRCINLRDL
jgi:aspartokinase-like uncharacterized kinase